MDRPLNFQKEVIDRSQTIPVLVDFWAPWCGPCRVLGPVIEQLAKEQKDRWELVKVNTEEEVELAQEYRIMSIPHVKLFHRGEAIAEFSGALSRAMLMRWLDENVPDERKGELNHILENLQQGDTIDPEILEIFVAQNPDVQEARLALARLLVLSDPLRARELVEDIRIGNSLFDQAEDVRLLAELNEIKPNAHQVTDLLIQAREALERQDNEKAIQAVIQAVITNKSFQNDLPRRLAIALFRGWGNQHELTKKYRRQFDMALY